MLLLGVSGAIAWQTPIRLLSGSDGESGLQGPQRISPFKANSRQRNTITFLCISESLEDSDQLGVWSVSLPVRPPLLSLDVSRTSPWQVGKFTRRWA